MKIIAASKSELIEEYIVKRILPKYRSGEKIPSELELSIELQTSRPTIHKILSNLTAKGVLYRENGLGTFICEPNVKNKTILAVIPAPDYLSPNESPSWFNIQFMLEGFTQRANQAGAVTNMTYLHPDRQSIKEGVDTLMKFKSDAILFPDLGGNGPLIEALTAKGQICIIREPYCSGLTHSVYARLKDGVKEAIRYFIHTGRKNIAIFTRTPGSIYVRERFEGYSEVLAEYNMPIDDRLIWECDGFTQNAYIETMKKLSSGIIPDAIFGGPDLQCFGIMQALQEKGVRIPDDIAIIGVDNMPEDTKQQPPLSSISFPLRQMGNAMFEIFQEAMSNAGDGKFIHRSFECPLIIRSSC